MRLFRRLTDADMDLIITAVLRIGVTAAAAVVLAGGIYYLIQYGAMSARYRVFHGEPVELRSLGGIVTGAIALGSRAIISLGLLLLILTPIARVLFSLLAFAAQRDRLYVVVTLIVLTVLLYNLIVGYR
jgi:uncharacterized membrane protein